MSNGLRVDGRFDFHVKRFQRLVILAECLVPRDVTRSAVAIRGSWERVSALPIPPPTASPLLHNTVTIVYVIVTPSGRELCLLLP